MRKREELTNPNSCMSRAQDDEMTFVLLGRDPAAPVAIKAWAHERVRIGKNVRDDGQILEALQCAATMIAEQESAGTLPLPVVNDHLCRVCLEPADESRLCHSHSRLNDDDRRTIDGQPLRVVRAAILDKFGGVHSLPRPARHDDIINSMVAKGLPRPITGEQGFLLNDGRFVMRKAAAHIAISAGQCTKIELPGMGLLSQDVW